MRVCRTKVWTLYFYDLGWARWKYGQSLWTEIYIWDWRNFLVCDFSVYVREMIPGVVGMKLWRVWLWMSAFDSHEFDNGHYSRSGFTDAKLFEVPSRFLKLFLITPHRMKVNNYWENIHILLVIIYAKGNFLTQAGIALITAWKNDTLQFWG